MDAGLTLRDRVLGGVVGLVVGDALGLPVQFLSRAQVASNPVTGMRGGGAFDLPAGTWSDDSSMALSIAASLPDGYDPRDIMERFRRWFVEGEMTPYGEAFDVGATTERAIRRYLAGDPSDRCGLDSEENNGNGSLMRNLPLAIYLATESQDEIVAKSFEISALTHAHIRAKLCCAYHSLVVRELLGGKPLEEAMRSAGDLMESHLTAEEESHLLDVLSGDILVYDRSDIESTGYVVHTLEASLWSCARFDDFRAILLEAVNLGGDADTIGAVTGGLAGVMHGFAAIPTEWIDALVKRDEVVALAERFADHLVGRSGGGLGNFSAS